MLTNSKIANVNIKLIKELPPYENKGKGILQQQQYAPNVKVQDGKRKHVDFMYMYWR